MSITARADLVFGVVIRDPGVLPWFADRYSHGDDPLEDWWLDTQGFVPTVRVYDDNRNFLPGVQDADIETLVREERQWLQDNPVPVLCLEVGYPGSGTHVIAGRGAAYRAYYENAPVEIHLSGFWALVGVDTQVVCQFLDTYGIPHSADPSWHLACYYRV